MLLTEVSTCSWRTRERWRKKPRKDDSLLSCLHELCASPRRHWSPLSYPRANEAFLWHIEPSEIARYRQSADATHAAASAAPETDYFEAFVNTDGGKRGVPHVDFGDAGRADLPAKARELLARGMCFTMSRTGLWPAAEAKWGSAEYLREQLAAVEGGMHVLANTAREGGAKRRRLFTYFKDGEGGDFDKPEVAAVHMHIADYLDHRGERETRDVPLMQPAGVAARDVCLYLQQSLLELKESGGEMRLEPGVGAAMARDVAQLNMARLQQLQHAGGFGRWRVSQLFVGTEATSGARSFIHFDHNDNIFLQIAGSKRFRLFAPTEAGNLYAFPCHHPMDRKAQVDLARESDPQHASAFLRLAHARSYEVTLRAGDVLFLPAYWWHEVLTEPVPPG